MMPEGRTPEPKQVKDRQMSQANEAEQLHEPEMDRSVRKPEVQQTARLQDSPGFLEGLPGLLQMIQHVDQCDGINGPVAQMTRRPDLLVSLQPLRLCHRHGLAGYIEADPLPLPLSAQAQESARTTPDVHQHTTLRM